MNILYAIQGTGNGHLSRARVFLPLLEKHAKTDILISGNNADVGLHQPVKYKMSGISYTFGKNGGIDYVDTMLKLRPIQFLKDVADLPVQKYDLIISDYEPVSAWAVRKAGLNCIGLSHQSAFLSSKSPRPDSGSVSTEMLFKHYAPCTHPIGFHYLPYDNFIHPPIIRDEVRLLRPTTEDHITVYLPAYSEERLIPIFQRFPAFKWHIFSKHTDINRVYKNVAVRPVNNKTYLQSLESAFAVISGGGFEAPAEALYLEKKLMIIPMHDQYEQKCNAEALRRLGVYVVERIGKDFHNALEKWFETPQNVQLDFPDLSKQIVTQILDLACNTKSRKVAEKRLSPIFQNELA